MILLEKILGYKKVFLAREATWRKMRTLEVVFEPLGLPREGQLIWKQMFNFLRN